MRAAPVMQSLPFDPADARTILAQIPESAAVFALYGVETHAEPYIGRTPNLRARLERLLVPSARHPKRLQLAGLVRRIEWRQTGSEFESLLLQFHLLSTVYGTKGLERMHLRAPAFVRFLGSNPYPRVVVTHRPSLREAGWVYGPFASRAAADRYVDEMLKLFLLRRCTDDLHPDPSFPGCVYSEMKMCLAPCYKGCTDERYAEEAAAVEGFLATRGESRLVLLRADREEASAALEFEMAAAIHAQVQKMESVRALAPELVQPINRLRGVILQASASPDAVAVFLFENGRMSGPADFSTVGMRIQNEQSGSSSLFAQPIAVEAVPENIPNSATRRARAVLEERMEAVLAELHAEHAAPTQVERQGHMALLKRWYYRPEARRMGEIFFPDAEDNWPIKSILRGVGRVAARSLASRVPPQPSKPERD